MSSRLLPYKGKLCGDYFTHVLKSSEEAQVRNCGKLRICEVSASLFDDEEEKKGNGR
jgi:hypothetical protein